MQQPLHTSHFRVTPKRGDRDLSELEIPLSEVRGLPFEFKLYIALQADTRQLLGWATFLSNLVLCGALAICLAFHTPLRRKMGLLYRSAQNDMSQALSEAPRAARISSTSKDVLKDAFLTWN